MSKNLSAKYYQKLNKDYKKKIEKDIKIFLRKGEKSNNMVVNITKISQKIKNKYLLSIVKNLE